MKAYRACFLRITQWAQSCGLVLIGSGLLLALAAAAWNVVSKGRSHPSAGALLWSAVVYLVLAGIGLAGLRWIHRRWGSRGFLFAALGGSLLIQLGVLFAADAQWEWTGDSRIFQHYLTALSDTGYTQETLEELSRNYDYRVWTRRAQPFYYLLRVGAGPHFVLAVQFFQALLLTLALGLTWRIARLLFNRQVAFWAVSLQVLMPFRWIACIDLNHHILGGVYFLAGLWILAEWLRPNRSLLRSAGLFLCAGLLLPLMRLEGGIDTVYLGSVILVLFFSWITGRLRARQTAVSVAVLLIWPLLLSTVLLSPLFHRIHGADRHRHESGPLGFMARGWVPETGGEYSYTPEQIDFLTPHETKLPMQAALLVSQAYYNPKVLMTRLLPVKMAKYGLLGYAAGAEEMFDRNGASRAKHFVEGARSVYLLAVLPLVLWGILLILPRLRRPRYLCLVLPCTLIYLSFVLLGETSPRYSIYIQPVLFMLGALPLALRASRRRQLLRQARLPALAAALTLVSLWGIAALVLVAARPWMHTHAVEDMRGWKLSSDSRARTLAATLAPFEIQLLPAPHGTGSAWGRLAPPQTDAASGILSFYALPAGATSGQLRGALLVTEYNTPDGVRRQTNSLPGRIRLEYSLSAEGSLSFRSPGALPFPLRIGYATYESHEKTTN